MVSVKFQLEDNLDEKLNSVCDKKGYNKEGLIRNLVETYLDRNDPHILPKLKTANFSTLCSVIDSDEVG